MGPKKGLLSSEEFKIARAAEDAKIMEENQLFIGKVQARVDFQYKKLLEFGDGNLTYPIDMKNRFNDASYFSP